MSSFPSEPPPTKSKDQIYAIMERLKQAIWNRRPILGEIMQKHGMKILSEYSRDFMDVNPAPGIDERKPELIAMVEELVAGRLGEATGKGVAKQLMKLPLVSTADHHSINQHPFFLNAEIISGIPLYEDPDPDIRYTIAFSFAGVSVNNLSGFARGILFNGGINGSTNLIKLPIQADRFKMSTIYACKPYTREDLTKAENEILKKEREGVIAAGKGEKVAKLMEDLLGDAHVLKASNFCSQLTRINHRFWPNLFHGSHHGPMSSGRSVPELVYLDIETLTTQTILRHHISNTSTLIHSFIFKPTLRPMIQKHFDGIPGAFCQAKNWGTFLFWGLDEKVRRVRMFLKDDHIVSEDRSIDVALTPQAIEQALRTKKIFPSMLLCYLLISLYYGMKCLGGFCQVHDLTLCKEAWVNMLREIGNPAEADAIAPIQTKELGGDGLVLSYLRTAQGSLVPAMGFDMLLDEGDTSFDRYVALSKKVTLQEMMNPMLPEMYTVLYADSERDPELLSVKPEEIFQATEMDRKMAA